MTCDTEAEVAQHGAVYLEQERGVDDVVACTTGRWMGMFEAGCES